MPAELTEGELRDAMAVVQEWDRGGARAAEATLEWMGWEGDGPLFLRRYDVQLFVWYTLPRKFLASLEDKRDALDALARTLERLGGRAASYAELCRSDDTDELLHAWEREDREAWRRLEELLERSGIEPPDTELLAWGRVMGLEEARVREHVATALEEAIEAGQLVRGTRGFKRRQGEIADAALRAPWGEGDRRSRLDAVRSERLQRWLERGHTRGSPERSAIVERVAALVTVEPPAIDAEAARAALALALWLLEQGEGGITLTQTGALNRALVREVAERWPDWWDADLFGPPHRETDLALLCELHELLRRLRLVRRAGRRLVTTARGRRLRADPAALLLGFAEELLAGESFRAACAELAAALIVDGAVADYSGALASKIQPAIVAEGWRSAGRLPEVRDVAWAVADFLRPAEAIGVLERIRGGSRRSYARFVLTEVGRTAMIGALRARALAPAQGPY